MRIGDHTVREIGAAELRHLEENGPCFANWEAKYYRCTVCDLIIIAEENGYLISDFSRYNGNIDPFKISCTEYIIKDIIE